MSETAAHSTGAETRVHEMGLELPAIRPPAGTYVHAVVSGDVIYLAGHVPIRGDGSVVFGKLGVDLDLAAGYDAARVCALSALATLRHELGSLDRVERMLRVYAVVNAAPDFTGHTAVANGASDLFVAVFGDAGAHARLAVGVSSLPANIACEIEVTARVRA